MPEHCLRTRKVRSSRALMWLTKPGYRNGKNAAPSAGGALVPDFDSSARRRTSKSRETRPLCIERPVHDLRQQSDAKRFGFFALPYFLPNWRRRQPRVRSGKTAAHDARVAPADRQKATDDQLKSLWCPRPHRCVVDDEPQDRRCDRHALSNWHAGFPFAVRF